MNARRLSPFVLLLIIAVCHYAAYYRHGLNFRDEGGTVALVAQRMLAGERPFADVALGGYNVLWFWPVVALFKVVGVNYVALRVFCFAMATVTALLVWWIVERAGRRPWLAFFVALIAVLVPGMTFKNYMPLLSVANSAALLGFTLSTPGSRERLWRLFGGGVLLGVTFLIRVDLGIFFTVLWIGGSVLSAFHRGLSLRDRLAAIVLTPLLLLATATVCHVPCYLDARQRGYDASFLGQYQLWPKMLANELVRLLPSKAPPALPQTTPAAEPTASREILARKSWRDVFSAPRWDDRLLAALLYLPLLSLAPLALFAFVRWLRAEGEAARRALAALLVVGGAFTVFPQYFFFRPDSPHLSESSPAFWAAAAAAPLLLSIRGWAGRLVTSFLALHAAVFFYRMVPDRWAGTIWVRKGRAQLFEAENGVRVRMTKREAQTLGALREIIRAHSQPDDYLVAYPYHPAINLLANRRTYERDVYVDNATRSEHWDAEAIARIEKYRPAVIVLSDWAVNGHDESRFSVWAGATRAWIQQHYEAQGIFPVSSDRFEVYTRPAKP